MTTAHPGQPHAILKGASASELIARLGQDDLVENGRLHVLGIDAIRERNGGRWPIRQEGVWDYINREFQKNFLECDHLIRMDEVNFLLIQPTQGAVAAQGRAITLLRTVLKFFLGQAESADFRLQKVAGVDGQGLKCESIAVAHSMLARLDEVDTEASQLSAPAAEDKNETQPALSDGDDGHQPNFDPHAWRASETGHPARLSPRLLRGHRQYDILTAPEPIWSIKQQAIASYAMRPSVLERGGGGSVPADMATVSTRGLIEIDLIVLGEAKRILQSIGPAASFALSVPINQSTLSSNAGRQAVQSALDQMKPYAASSLIACIVGLAAGAPNSKVVEQVSLLRSRCRAVIARAPDLEADVTHWRGAHLSGISVDLSSGATEKAPSAAQLSQFARRMGSFVPALIAYGSPSSAVTLTAWASGFTHVGADGLLGALDQRLAAVRFHPEDLYRRQRQLSA